MAILKNRISYRHSRETDCSITSKGGVILSAVRLIHPAGI